ncbi:MAG: hypothetical protein IJQ34_03305 [Kiritimatiellae bacterium]|nr:hypothetical protein [Kiritimatiellia bacterium]
MNKGVCEQKSKAANFQQCLETMGTTDLQVESSYVEDGLLNILVSPKIAMDEKPGDPECRWTIIANPQSKEIVRVDFCIATDEGFEYPQCSPTQDQLILFQHFVMEC